MNFATIVSLAISLGVCGFWVYAELPPHLVGYSRGCVFASFCEDAEYIGGFPKIRPDGGGEALCYAIFTGSTPAPHRFAFRSGRLKGGGGRWWTVAIPLWSILVVTALLPAARVAGRLRRGRRRRVGLCVSCGYDLTGNKSGACPECGTAIARAVDVVR
jgi:hypothetical protein